MAFCVHLLFQLLIVALSELKKNLKHIIKYFLHRLIYKMANNKFFIP